MQEDWKYLIVLDACRFDYFAAIHKEFLSGDLEKVISLGTTTIEWCRKNFTKHYNDIVYVSANPYINSIGEVEGFKACDHFHKIVDVWNLSWDERLGTVYPHEVNKFAKIVNNTYPNKRLIIHYLQPHAPYLDYEEILCNSGFPKPDIQRGYALVRVKGQNYGIFTRNFIKLLYIFVRYGFFGEEVVWKSLELLNLPPFSPMDVARRRLGKKGLRVAYAHNLTVVLKCVSELIKELSGTIVITADHGELLGEGGRYSHYSESNNPLLLEVPWLVIKQEKAQ